MPEKNKSSGLYDLWFGNKALLILISIATLCSLVIQIIELGRN